MHRLGYRRAWATDREGDRVGPAAPELPLEALQHAAGNAAVSGLVTGISVQRFWPFDDDEEEVPANPEEVPNVPAEPAGPAAPAGPAEPAGPGDGSDRVDLDVPFVYIASMSHGAFNIVANPVTPGVRASSAPSQGIVTEYAARLPFESLPPDLTEGAGGVIADGRNVFRPADQAYVRQLFRHWVGQPCGWEHGAPPGGGGGTSPVPGSGTGPGGGAAPAPPGMEPVPHGEGPGPGSAPGIPSIPLPGGVPGAGGEAPGPVRPMIRRGSSGDDVRYAQTRLNDHGASLDADGIFGPATQAAVIEFQRARGLSPDGIVGPLTWAALDSPV